MVTVGKVPIEVVMNIRLSFYFKNSILGTQRGYSIGAALFSRIIAINSSDQKKILARLKKMVLEHSQKIGATRQPFLGQLLLFLPTARR